MIHNKIKLNETSSLVTYVLENHRELAVSSRPGILICPGGGYAFCSEREAEQVAIAFNNYGYNAFVLYYTTGQGPQRAIEDGLQALKYLKENKDEYSLNKIIMCGFSAGANLTLSTSLLTEDKPDGMILIYPPIRDFTADIDLLSLVNEKTPKAFIVHSFPDTIVPIDNTLSILNAFNKHKVEFEAHIFRSGEHGYSLATKPIGTGDSLYENHPNASWFNQCITWIKQGVGDIEFNKKVTIEDLPLILQKESVDSLSRSEKALAVIEKHYPGLVANCKRLGFSSFPIGNSIIYGGELNLDLVRIFALELEKAL